MADGRLLGVVDTLKISRHPSALAPHRSCFKRAIAVVQIAAVYQLGDEVFRG
jgi:hypothetical protein